MTDNGNVVYEEWVPQPHPTQVFKVGLNNLKEVKTWMNAKSINQAYAKGGVVVIDILLTNREEMTALIGEYVIKDHNGKFHVVTEQELRRDYEKM